jgi:hypothetical protein
MKMYHFGIFSGLAKALIGIVLENARRAGIALTMGRAVAAR